MGSPAALIFTTPVSQNGAERGLLLTTNKKSNVQSSAAPSNFLEGL